MAAVGALQSVCRITLIRSPARWINCCMSYRVKQFSSSTCWASRKFSKKHEWVEVSGTSGKIGITNYAQDSLGDIVYAQLPEVNSEYAQGDECGALESVKAASELYSPVSGKIIAVNTAAEEQPSLINQSCYDEGWLFEVELTKPEEIEALMEEADYDNFVRTLADS
ncbi:Glycine cleavage system H-protein [Trinorchestia longiramus]|nr:Glycine cleavage system H-protein [Trinorchestia longiramus]